MSETMDVTSILKRRKELLAVLAEGETAREQIKLYNRIIVLKAGDKAMPGVPDDVDPGPRLAVPPVPETPCPIAGCDKVFSGAFHAPGVKSHLRMGHKLSAKSKKLDELTEQVREGLRSE